MTYKKPLSDKPEQKYTKVDGLEIPVKENPITNEIKIDLSKKVGTL